MKSIFKKAMALLLVMLMSMGVIAPAVAEGEDTIKLAVIAPLTGDFAQYGEAYRTAVELMVSQVNAEGGINGKQLTYDIFDDKNDAKESATLAGRIADDGSYIALLGPFASTCALATAPIMQNAGIVEMCPTCTHPDLTATGDYIFRGVITSQLEAPIFADVTLNKLGASKVGIIYTQDDWGITTEQEYANKLTELGGTVVIAENYISGSTRDFTPILTKIAGEDIDLLFVAAMYNDSAMILEQLKQLGYEGKFKVQGTGSLYTDEFLQLAGENAEGMYITASFYAANPAENVQAFVSAYKEMFGSEPNLFAASVYDGAGLIVEALKNGATDSASLRDNLAAIREYDGVTGKASFNENRDVIKDEVVLKIENGQFVYVD